MKKSRITAHDAEYPYYIIPSRRDSVNLNSWRQIPLALGISDLSQYVQYLKSEYPDVNIRANLGRLPNQVTGLQISFKSLEQAEHLLQLLIRR